MVKSNYQKIGSILQSISPKVIISNNIIGVVDHGITILLKNPISISNVAFAAPPAKLFSGDIDITIEGNTVKLVGQKKGSFSTEADFEISETFNLYDVPTKTPVYIKRNKVVPLILSEDNSILVSEKYGVYSGTESKKEYYTLSDTVYNNIISKIEKKTGNYFTVYKNNNILYLDSESVQIQIPESEYSSIKNIYSPFCKEIKAITSKETKFSIKKEDFFNVMLALPANSDWTVTCSNESIRFSSNEYNSTLTIENLPTVEFQIPKAALSILESIINNSEVINLSFGELIIISGNNLQIALGGIYEN